MLRRLVFVVTTGPMFLLPPFMVPMRNSVEKCFILDLSILSGVINRTFTFQISVARLRLLADRGVSVLLILDDWLVSAPSLGLLLDAFWLVMNTTDSMGFLNNHVESQLTASQLI